MNLYINCCKVNKVQFQSTGGKQFDKIQEKAVIFHEK